MKITDNESAINAMMVDLISTLRILNGGLLRVMVARI